APTAEDAYAYVRFDEHLSARIKTFLLRQGLTVYMLLLAGFMAVLHLCTRRTRLAVCSPFANPTQLETEGMIGYFANSHILRVECLPDTTCLDLLYQVRDVLMNAQLHQDVPMALAWTHKPRSPAGDWLSFDMLVPPERHVGGGLRIERSRRGVPS